MLIRPSSVMLKVSQDLAYATFDTFDHSQVIKYLLLARNECISGYEINQQSGK